jgi:hypothetical protein
MARKDRHTTARLFFGDLVAALQSLWWLGLIGLVVLLLGIVFEQNHVGPALVAVLIRDLEPVMN